MRPSNRGGLANVGAGWEHDKVISFGVEFHLTANPVSSRVAFTSSFHH